MKSITTIFLLLGSLALASAQSFRIDRLTIDGGGGISTGGGYTLAGSIARPDGRPLRGGSYTLTGGFWSKVAVVQTPDAPLLSAHRTTTNTIVLSWPGPEAGWKLQTTTGFSSAPAVWREIAPPYQTGPAGIFVIEPMPSGSRFYRLWRPAMSP